MACGPCSVRIRFFKALPVRAEIIQIWLYLSTPRVRPNLLEVSWTRKNPMLRKDPALNFSIKEYFDSIKLNYIHLLLLVKVVRTTILVKTYGLIQIMLHTW